MSILIALAVPVALFGLKYAAEDRPGFNERTPLS
jgi:hypothetical protein